MYEQTADFIKSFCGTKKPDEIYFSLKNYKDLRDNEMTAKLYKEDSVLKPIASITEGEIFGYELDDETIIYTVKTAELFTLCVLS